MGAARRGGVANGGQSGVLQELVAVSLLWAESGTRVARHFRALVDERGGRTVLEKPGAARELFERVGRDMAPGASAGLAEMRAALARARLALEQAASSGIACVHVGQHEYPDRLWQIPDPPPVLWVLGRAEALTSPAVAVVGARQATPAGLSIATRLSRELAQAGLTVVSGLARGVDGAAHKGALEAGGVTVAIQGCGPDLVYPREHTALARRICESGTLATEFPPGSQPLPWRFPLRNRVISGLSRAVVVIEASDKSGSLITARAALEQGRDVLAVPGSVASGRYRGGHALIKDGARLVETVEDVLEEIGWARRAVPAAGEADKELIISNLERIMAPGESYTLDDLAALTGQAAPALLAELAALELAGRVVRVGGGNFAKT
jgi:DNA processing protein